jgi:hypothetical protein
LLFFLSFLFSCQRMDTSILSVEFHRRTINPPRCTNSSRLPRQRGHSTIQTLRGTRARASNPHTTTDYLRSTGQYIPDQLTSVRGIRTIKWRFSLCQLGIDRWPRGLKWAHPHA